MKMKKFVATGPNRLLRWVIRLALMGWVLAGLEGFPVPFASGEELKVIVHKSNPVDSLSFYDLVKIFKGDKQFWPNGEKVVLLMRESGSPEKEVILRSFYKMSEEKQKQYWLEKVFRGEATGLPKILNSSSAMKKVLSNTPNAIGYLLAGEADGSVKAVKIEGAEALK
ncbi:MAG: hypothetical protein HYS70_00860 [Nitrospinae bacterium]|nr:hypothetical protein [Nitrospinota bacterium]